VNRKKVQRSNIVSTNATDKTSADTIVDGEIVKAVPKRIRKASASLTFVFR
jgi:hypothetical protein